MTLLGIGRASELSLLSLCVTFGILSVALYAFASDVVNLLETNTNLA